MVISKKLEHATVDSQYVNDDGIVFTKEELTVLLQESYNLGKEAGKCE